MVGCVDGFNKATKCYFLAYSGINGYQDEFVVEILLIMSVLVKRIAEISIPLELASSNAVLTIRIFLLRRKQ